MSIDNVYIPQSGGVSDLNDWILGALGTCLVKLYASNTPYLPTNIASDYTEASFVGYAAVPSPSWSAAYINGSGAAETDSPPLTWTFTAGSGTATVFGLYITDSTGTALLAVVPFQSPVILTPTVPTVSRTVQLTAISQL